MDAHLDMWGVDYSDIRLGAELGRGSYGKVGACKTFCVY